MEELREEVGVRGFKEEAHEELVNVGWTCGTNGREQLMKTADELGVEVEEEKDSD